MNKMILLYSVIAILLMLIATWGVMGVSFDSKRYIVVGDNFADMMWKDGLRILLPHHAPLYPMTLGMLGWLGIRNGGAFRFWGLKDETRRPGTQKSSDLIASRIVSILGFTCLIGIMMVLANSLAGILVAHLTAIGLLVFQPLIWLFSWCWSETLYLPLSALCLFFMVKYERERKDSHIAISSFFAMLAFLTRVFGLSLIVVGFILTLLERPLKLKRLLFWCGASVPGFFYLTYDRITAPSQLSLGNHLFDFILALFNDWGSLGVFLLLFVVWVFWKKRAWQYLKSSMKPIILYVVVYLVILFGIESTVHIDHIDTRLLSPIYPFVLLVISLAIKEVLTINENLD